LLILQYLYDMKNKFIFEYLIHLFLKNKSQIKTHKLKIITKIGIKVQKLYNDRQRSAFIIKIMSFNPKKSSSVMLSLH